MSNSGNDNADRAQEPYAAGTTDRDSGPIIIVPPKVIVITGGFANQPEPMLIRSDRMEFFDPADKGSTIFHNTLPGRIAGITIQDNLSGPNPPEHPVSGIDTTITIRFLPTT